MACGCVVFTSLNHALADHCDPGRSAHQIGCGSLAHDLQRIQAAVAEPLRWRPPMAELGALLQNSGEQRLLERWRQVLTDLDQLQLQWQLDAPQQPIHVEIAFGSDASSRKASGRSVARLAERIAATVKPPINTGLPVSGLGIR